MTDDDADLHRNDGVMVLNADAALPRARTLIVTGGARSGTSMAARALTVAGVDMGAVTDDVVFEDAEVAAALADPDRWALARLAALRDARSDVWGFKRPHLFRDRGPDVEAAFREPRFVVIARDPVAVARRNRISELTGEPESLREAAADGRLSMEFALGLRSPVLLVSYEKALRQPDAFVDRLVAFCGLAVPSGARARMILSVEADRPEYLRSARRRYEGYVDGVEKQVVYGWCRQVGLEEPLLLDVAVGGGPAVQTAADRFRPDLAAAGFASHCHGFRLDISPFIRTGDEKVSVRVHDRSFELTGSGLSVRELAERG